MSAPTLIRRELKNASVYFIPEGENVDGDIVSSVLWPDPAPAENYGPYQFLDIEMLKESKEVETETFKIPKATGGYTNDTEEMLVKRMWTATTAKTNSILKKLEHALADAVVASTPQAPFVNNSNYVDGVMLLKIQNKNGVLIERTRAWVRLRLVTAGDVGPTTAKVEFSLEQRDNELNSYTVFAG